MRIWNSWYEALEWLEWVGAENVIVCVSDWQDDEYLTVLKYNGRNFFKYPWPYETCAFFFE